MVPSNSGSGLRPVWWFYAITLGLAVLTALAAPWLGNLALMLTMVTPTVGAVLMLAVIAPEGGLRHSLSALGLTRPGWRGWLPAIILPTGVLVGGTLLMGAVGLTALGPSETYLSFIDTALNLIVMLIIGTVLATFEEIGWRGYLLPRTRSVGIVGGMLLVGFLHGVWHLPLLLGTDLYHNSGSPFLVVPMFLTTLTLAGVLYGWLRMWSGSIWPVALAHAAVNTAWGFSDSIVQTRTPMVTEYIGGESGVLMILGLVILDIFLVRSILRLPAKPLTAPEAT
ncbi:CPBP family glutamic-type intramembrane protease [Tabrizicola sp. BL-A-41-H6]|uniref:CPBP family glutamic-type intramembrane protease n=1 Tax=Tabrizicola sp. BL-A-41-H6 TaxID=3421107 RepID=UPI003D676049